MIEKVVEVKCIESFNPASESSNKTYHGITIVYEDTNKDIPYVVCGDKLKLIIIPDEDE